MKPHRRNHLVPVAQHVAGGYIRVSLDKTIHQGADEIVSPDTQEDRIKAYCQSQGWALAVLRSDIDESAYRQHYSRRKGLMELLVMIDQGEINKLVVWKFSRLSRRLREFLEICDRVESVGAGIVSLTEQVDTSTPAGRMLRNIMASFAQYQSEELAEQIFHSGLTKAKQGSRPAGRRPFGALVVKRSEGGKTIRTLEPDPDTYAHLQAMFRIYVQSDGSLTAVWDYLYQNHVKTLVGTFPWYLDMVRGVLRNPAYVGLLRWSGEDFGSAWQPLIDPELWQQAQALLDQRQRPEGFRRGDVHPLSGLIICGQCDKPYAITIMNTLTQDGAPPQYQFGYSCKSKQSHRRRCPDALSLDASTLEEAVRSALTRISVPTTDEQMAVATSQLREGIDETSHRLSSLQAQEERLKKQVRQLFDLLADDSITREQFVEQNRQYQQDLASIQEERSALEGQSPPVGREGLLVARAALEQLPSVWNELSGREKRQMLITAGVQIRVEDRNVYVIVQGCAPVRLRSREIHGTLFFGSEVNRLDYAGPGGRWTDLQLRFLCKAYRRGISVSAIANRLGKTNQAVRDAASRLRREGVELPDNRSRFVELPS